VNDHLGTGRLCFGPRGQRSREPSLPRAALYLFLGFAVLTGSPDGTIAVGAESGPPTDGAAAAAAKSIEEHVERRRVEARGKLLAKETDRLRAVEQAGPPGRDIIGKLKAAEPAVREAIAPLLADSARPVEQDLQGLVRVLDRQIQEMTAAWRDVRAADRESKSLLASTSLAGDTAGGVPWLLSLDDRWFWASVLGALAVLVAVTLHTHRHGVRRWFGRRFGRLAARLTVAGTLLVLILGAAALGLSDRLGDGRASGEPSEAGTTPGAVAADASLLEGETRTAIERARTLEAQRGELQKGSRQRLADAVAGVGDLPALAEGFRDRVLEIGQRLAILEDLPKALEADLADLAQVREDLTAAAEVSAEHLGWRRTIRSGIGLATFGLVAVGGWFLGRGVKRRRAVRGNTCPLCLGAIRPGPASRNGRVPPGSQVVRCENVLDAAKGIRCNYAIRDAYRPMAKVCFPTLGVPRAGKTHWLAMLYWQLNRGNFPRSLRFEKVRPVEAASGEDFDRIVEQILVSRLGTTGTQGVRIPHPLVFNFRDRDRWGPSSLLVNIFDYSGEVTATLSLDDYRRRRAMDADGYLFFLDPTLPAEPQAKALAEFREDVRLVKGVGSTRRLQLPLALCVSKIDLLAGQSYALPDGRDAVAQFYDDLARIDPTGEAMTLDVIEARSALVARLRDTVWPGWQIERTIQDLFGGRVQYFPLTPVGLDGAGEKDLNLRTIAPFGLLEPLVWLLHMNGYPVLR
jgi:hypothetical protein